ncbi:MAG: hypothetical protein GVY13_16200, partial [Alphaproteobacteria bacterium]|nr:hypothetical protein [Alphaproteobacteria bacterium]
MTTVDGRDAPAPGVTPFLAQFELERPALPGAGQVRLETLRDTGIAAFAARGIPSRKVEDWKYTDVRKLAGLEFVSPSPEPSGAPVVAETLDFFADAVHRLVFVNGRFRPDLSALDALPPGVRLASLAAAIGADDPVVETWLGALAAPV